VQRQAQAAIAASHLQAAQLPQQVAQLLKTSIVWGKLFFAYGQAQRIADKAQMMP
jgi:hypothetical protein